MKLPLLMAVFLALAPPPTWVVTAWAATEAPLSAEEQAANPDANPDDGELASFVAAFVRLVGVQHGYMMLMQDENDPDRIEAIKKSALTDMTAAVEQDGLSVQRYNEIALAVRGDPDLQGRVEGILQQLAADPEAEQE